MRDYKGPNPLDGFQRLRAAKERVLVVRTTAHTLDEIAGPAGGGVLRAGLQMWVEKDGAWWLQLSEPYRDSDCERAFEMFCAGFEVSAEGENGEYTNRDGRSLSLWLAEQFEKVTGMPAPEIVEGA